MVLNGNDIIIITKEEARKLLETFCTPSKVHSLQKAGLLNFFSQLRDAIREEEVY